MTTVHLHGEPDPPPPVPRWRYVAVVIAAVVLIGGGVTWLLWPESRDCSPGVQRVEGNGVARCVGLTDGRFPFTDDLKRVSALIEKENRRVTEESEQSGGMPYAGVVYLMGMSPGKGDSNTVASVRHELEGAYTAQIEANQRFGQGNTPQIKLLLAETGNTEAQRDHTLAQITARRDSDRIVAVAGLGTSLTDTKGMVSRLTAADIASFGSVITADALEEISGLVRAAPPNADEAAAAVKFLAGSTLAKSKVLIVKDANKKDLYTQTLANKFGEKFPRNRLVTAEPMQYDSSKDQLATYFMTQMANLCQGKPDVVYFAGRGRDLPDFLAPLAGRTCNSRMLTVLSGDDMSQATQTVGFEVVQQALRTGNIKLVYTGLAHPDAWAKEPEYYQRNAIEPFLPSGTFKKNFKQDELDDGQAIMGYDAVIVAVRAIRLSHTPESSDQATRRKAVVQMLSTLNTKNAIAGASGWISLRNNGSPEDKAIPIIEIGADGRTKAIAVVSGGSTGRPYLPPPEDVG